MVFMQIAIEQKPDVLQRYLAAEANIYRLRSISPPPERIPCFQAFSLIEWIASLLCLIGNFLRLDCRLLKQERLGLCSPGG